MTIESNHAIVIATHGDCLKNDSHACFFQLIRSKTSNTPCITIFPMCSPLKSQVISRNSDWFIELFASIAIVWSNYFGVGYFDRSNIHYLFVLRAPQFTILESFQSLFQSEPECQIFKNDIFHSFNITSQEFIASGRSKKTAE